MAKKEANIEIRPLELETVEFSIVGTMPLIVNAFSEKSKKQILDTQTKTKKNAKHEIKIPVNDFIGSLYWLTKKPAPGQDDKEAEQNWENAIADGAKFGFPVSGIKQSIISGAYRAGLDVKQTELRGTFFLSGATDISTRDVAEIISPNPPVMREDIVRVGGASKSADLRYRAEFEAWEIPLKLIYVKNGKYSLEQILNMVNFGGFCTGIGEWRPEKDGQNGMYQLRLK